MKPHPADAPKAIWTILVHAANVQDRDGAKSLLEALDEEQFPRRQTVFVDAGYEGKLEERIAEQLGLALRIESKFVGQSTFAWLMHYRGLRSEYETTVTSSVGWTRIPMIHRMVPHLVPE